MSKTETEEATLSRVVHRATAFCLTVFFLIFVVSVATNRGLFEDGAVFLLMMIAHGTYFTPFPSRVCANLLTQSPPLLLLHLGCHNFEVLGFVYSVSLFAVPLLSLFACYRMLRDKVLFIFPLLSYLFATLQSYSMIIGESHEMVALFWPMFIILLDVETLTRARKIALPLLAFFALRSYESSLFFFSFLFAVLIFNLVRTRSRAGFYWSFVSLIFLAGILLALYSIVHPENAANEGAFMLGIKYILLRNIHFYFMAGLFIVCLAARKSPFMNWTWIAGTSLAIFTGALIFFSFFPSALLMQYNHTFRALQLAVPLALAFGMAALVYLGRLRLLGQPWLWFSLVPMASYCLAVQLCCTLQWYGYVQALKMYLADEGTHRHGILLFDATPFAQKTMGRQVFKYISGGDAIPCLSILLADHGQVNLLIHDVAPGTYIPFPIDQPPALPPRFGVHYNYLTPSAAP